MVLEKDSYIGIYFKERITSMIKFSWTLFKHLFFISNVRLSKYDSIALWICVLFLSFGIGSIIPGPFDEIFCLWVIIGIVESYSKIEKAYEARKCCICMEKNSDRCLKPCNHVCLCEDCVKKVIESNNLCPICRRTILMNEKVFITETY